MDMGYGLVVLLRASLGGEGEGDLGAVWLFGDGDIFDVNDVGGICEVDQVNAFF